MTVPVCVFTADHRHPELRAFLHLYRKYWNWPLIIFGFKRPPYALEDNVTFVSLGDMKDYPAERWSDAAIKALNTLDYSHLVILLEDYWLTRMVDKQAVLQLAEYMGRHDDIVRCDLTSDRLYAENLVEVEPMLYLDIIENIPPAQYHLSLQAAIWNRKHLLYYLRPGETPWLTELNGTGRMMASEGYPDRAIGTRQFPVRYLIAVQAGKLALDGGYQVPKPAMAKADIDDALRLMSLTVNNTNYAFAGVAK